MTILNKMRVLLLDQVQRMSNGEVFLWKFLCWSRKFFHTLFWMAKAAVSGYARAHHVWHMWRFSSRSRHKTAPLWAHNIVNLLLLYNNIRHFLECTHKTGNQSFIGEIESRLGLPFGFVGDFWIPLAKICFFHFIRRFYCCGCGCCCSFEMENLHRKEDILGGEERQVSG